MDESENGSAGDGFAKRGEAGRRRREVVDRVKRRSNGKSQPDIEADLRIEFERAGIPQTSEQVTGIAQVISGGWFGLLRSAVRVAAGGQAPPGTRASRLRLTGQRWVDVEASVDPAAESAVRRYHRANGAIGSHMPAELNANLLSARLAVIGADDESRVGVFLGRSFVGTLPRVAASALVPTIIEADGRDQRRRLSRVCRPAVASAHIAGTHGRG